MSIGLIVYEPTDGRHEVKDGCIGYVVFFFCFAVYAR